MELQVDNRHGMYAESNAVDEVINPRKKTKTCGNLIKGFGETTTLHGLPRIINATSLLGKVIWSVVFIVALGAFIYQGLELLQLFLQYDVRVNIDVGTAPFLPFPAVTLCNTNKLRLSEIENSEHELLAKTDPDHEDTIHRLLSYNKFDTNTGTCLPGDFECNDGQRCIKPHLRCDGYYHCWDGESDEANCTYPKCGSDQFNCRQAGPYGVCISNNKLCDGIHHCLGGEDESNCPVCSAGTACDFGLVTSGYTCVPDSSKCDRFPDCIDGTDEESCYPDEVCENAYLDSSRYPRVLFSPNYPSDYDVNIECQISVRVSSWEYDDSCIVISFLELDIEPSANCTNDYIEIVDLENPSLTTRVCGSQLPPTWTSLSEFVMITFVSNGKSTGRGYRLQYSVAPQCPSELAYWETGPWSTCSAPCGGGTRVRPVFKNGCIDDAADGCLIAGSQPPNYEYCNTEICPGDDICQVAYTHCCPTLTSPNYPLEYPPDVDCETYIFNPEEGCVEIVFEEFDVVDSYECHKDYVEFGDGNDNTQRVCGEKSGLRWISASSGVTVKFHSDMVVSKKGYRAVYNFVPCGTWQLSPWSECSVACGYGMRFRRVVCWGRNTNMAIPDELCEGSKPKTEEVCSSDMCAIPPRAIVPDEVISMIERYGHITDDPNVYEDFTKGYFKDNEFALVESEDPPDWKGFLTYSSSPDYSDLQNVLKLSQEDVSRYGHQAKDFILQCSFEGIPCNSSDFHVFQNDYYGNCFTFNSWQGTSEERNSMRPGSKYGLKLTLYIEQNEYIALFGQEAGVRVMVHRRDTIPFPEEEGVTVAPGFKTSIGLRRDILDSPGHPYTKCINHGEFISIFGKGYNYSDMACHKSKIHEYILKECECAETLYMDGPRCQILNETQEECRQLMEFFYQRGLLSSDCQEPCKDVYYTTTLSQSRWPSNKHLGGLLKVLRPMNKKIRDNVVDKESTRDNLLRMEVYYEEFNYHRITKLPAYLIEELLGDIGGLLGLYIGLSLITVVEFLELFVSICRYALRRVSRK